MKKKYGQQNDRMKILVGLILSFNILLYACVPESEDAPSSEDTAGVPANTAQDILTPPVDLDLREANVIKVEFVVVGEESYRFDVTLLHDDDGETPNFADSWQVEDTSENVLGVRILLHSHGTQPFTRSEIIKIPQEVITVIVRGHDMLHGHGGQSMRVNLNSGSKETFMEDGN